MGCFYSRIEREEMVSRCKARKKYNKQLVQARQFMSTSHLMYLRALRSTGSALNIETNLRHHHHLLPPAISSPSPSLPPVPRPPPPMRQTVHSSPSSSPPPPPPP
ncbi:Protein ALTERED PHOSPHATE STARVATION RESPONSE 1 [Linum perenne]